MKVKQLDHVNLTVDNVAASADWYARVFGFEIVQHGIQDNVPWHIIKSGDAMLCIYQTPGRAFEDRFGLGDRNLHGVSHFSFRIDDEEQWNKTVADQGLELLYDGAIRWPHSTSWYVKDPTGYEIEVALWHGDHIAFDDVSPATS